MTAGPSHDSPKVYSQVRAFGGGVGEPGLVVADHLGLPGVLGLHQQGYDDEAIAKILGTVAW